jgi:uncharacterized protein YbaR (Trm112 family)
MDGDRLKRLNSAIATGAVRNNSEQSVDATLTEALITRDGRLIYPIRDGIPILLEDECIDWNRLPS